MHSRLLVGCAVVATLLTAACGSASPSPSPEATGTTIAVASNAKLGSILVDGADKTVYLFVADSGSSSTCYTTCAQIWPPVLTSGPAEAGAGASASLLGTTTRTDGKTEVIYAGHMGIVDRE